MPEQDYNNLMRQAVVTDQLQVELISRDPKRIEAVLRNPIYNFTNAEIEFLMKIEAYSIGEFARKTIGYWHD